MTASWECPACGALVTSMAKVPDEGLAEALDDLSHVAASAGLSPTHPLRAAITRTRFALARHPITDVQLHEISVTAEPKPWGRITRRP